MPHAQVPERASLTYRADIDGLRALAVVPVVLYHFHVAPFTGGYVGVDVFFVISGFLITGLIDAEMRTGEYSLTGFYERRARRILPALFAVVLASALAALWFLFPADLKRLGESAAATALFVSNFDFWQQTGYFDAGAEAKPLLHTWSLAVEEQFYLLFPLLLLLFRKVGRRTLLMLTAGLALASFLFGLWAVRRHSALAFYLAPARIWELMLGAMLALGEIPPAPRWLTEVLSLAGLALLGMAVFVFSPDTPIPGENALLPCLGAALLIFANARGGTLAARALSWRPVVFVGLISYSLYLWHWPVYVFARYRTLTPLAPGETAALIALSVGLAVLSWRFIERPFRDRRRFSRRQIFTLSGIAMVVCVACGGALFAAKGVPQRFSPQVQRILAEADDADPREHKCGGAPLIEFDPRFACVIGDPHAKPSFALWGDSHATALIAIVSDIAARKGRSGYYVGHVGCAPLLDVKRPDDPTRRCARVNAAALAFIERQNIREVILAGRWAFYDQLHATGPFGRTIHRNYDSAARSLQHVIFAREVEDTVAALVAGARKVVVIADVPEIAYDVPTSLARMALGAATIDIRVPLAAYRARQAFVERDFADLHRRHGVTVLEPAPILCDNSYCSVEDGGRPLYRDEHHLSIFGASHLTPMFDGIF